ncbi:MAG: 50S ribosomal protein L30 [Clostridia bacterium]|nr:50S ribosomal protein L30 [Clostridia bacterium]
MATKKSNKIKITLVKSTIAVLPAHKKIVKALGLTKINSFKVFEANDAILGMVAKVNYLLKVENV